MTEKAHPGGSKGDRVHWYITSTVSEQGEMNAGVQLALGGYFYLIFIYSLQFSYMYIHHVR